MIEKLWSLSDGLFLATGAAEGSIWGVRIAKVIRYLHEFTLAHLSTLAGFILAMVIVGHLFNERRSPSNIFAWSFLVFFVPYLGVPLYLLFGGRKSRRLVNNKKRVMAVARNVAAEAGDRSLGSGPIGGNSFRLLGDGEVAFAELCDSIDGATQSISIMTYILGNDETGREVVGRLTRKARAGVEVRLLIDALGSLGNGGRFLQQLREAGGHTARFLPVLPLQTKTSANLRNHRKIAIFDGSRAIVGGQNIDTRFLGKTPTPHRFLDCGAVIEGPAVQSLNRIFLSDWCFASGDDPKDLRGAFARLPAPAGDAEMQIIAGGPDIEGDPLWEAYVAMVQDCERELTIVTPYFVPDEVLFQSMMIKARAGRHIRLILPEKSNHRIVDFARGHYLRKLVQAGVDVQLYRPRMLHAKLMIRDSKLAILGSANVDMRSLFVNFEIGIVQQSPGPVNELQQWVFSILPDCIAYTELPNATAGRGRRWMEDFVHLVAPML